MFRTATKYMTVSVLFFFVAIASAQPDSVVFFNFNEPFATENGPGEHLTSTRTGPFKTRQIEKGYYCTQWYSSEPGRPQVYTWCTDFKRVIYLKRDKEEKLKWRWF